MFFTNVKAFWRLTVKCMFCAVLAINLSRPSCQTDFVFTTPYMHLLFSVLQVMMSFVQSQDDIIIVGPGFCQAFSDYQMQQMTSNFIEQFGFNDEEFADQDDVVE